MNKPKIHIRYREKAEHANHIWWYYCNEANSIYIKHARDFASRCDLFQAVRKATEFLDGSSSSYSLLLEKEIVMLRDDVQTFIDPDNAMQILALAAME